MQNNFDNKNNKSTQPFIDFETAWAGLKPELDAEAKRREKRKRRFIIFWFLLAAIGIGGGILMVNGGMMNSKLEMENGNKDLGIVNNEQSNAQHKILNATESSVEHNKINPTVEASNNDTKENNSITKEEYKVTKKQSDVANERNNITKVSNGVTNERLSITKEHNNVTKESSSVIKEHSNVANEPSSIAKKRSSVTKENSSITKEHTSIIKKHAKIAKENTNIVFANTDKAKANTIATVSNTKVTEANINVTEANAKVVTPNNNSLTKNEVITTQQLNNQPQTPNPKQAVNTKQAVNNLHYGLQWNVPVLGGVNYFDINTVKQPATLFIPTAWISKQFGKKHSVQLLLNPYSQYFVNNKAIVSYDIYTIKIQSGNQLNDKPNDIIYSETVSFNKLISIEASLLYNYQLTNKIKLGIGISNNWLQGALLQNRVVKNDKLVTRDSLYGINKHDKEWNNVESTFMLGKLELQYQLKKFDIGVSFSKPIGNVFASNVQNKTPVNTNLFLKWRFK